MPITAAADVTDLPREVQLTRIKQLLTSISAYTAEILEQAKLDTSILHPKYRKDPYEFMEETEVLCNNAKGFAEGIFNKRMAPKLLGAMDKYIAHLSSCVADGRMQTQMERINELSEEATRFISAMHEKMNKGPNPFAVASTIILLGTVLAFFGPKACEAMKRNSGENNKVPAAAQR